ncbi:MAG: cation/H(+) antiporter [Candidatus Puniceispirillum sp.]|nr:cation/H(+) antiporter [Candidatus Puniceispirillum sp.]
MGDLSHLTEIALVVSVALACGLFFERFKQPAILGYILAGILLGPSLLGLVHDRAAVESLAELGILMLLFLIGMELDLRALKEVWLVSLLTTLFQLGVSLLVLLGLGQVFGLPFGLSIVLACALALSSTAVAIKMLENINELTTQTGRLTIGVLIAQDLAIVPMILILKGMSGGSLSPLIAVKVLFAMGLLGALIWYLSRKSRIHIPFVKVVAENSDLTPLAALLFCFGMAVVAGVMGLSAAYGAFLGGLVLGNTSESHTMLKVTRPIQSVLMMVFFLSIGLLMDLGYIWDHLVKVLVLLAFITIGKTALNIFILHVLRQPWEQAFLSGLVLSQMGEFAFLLATVGAESGLLGDDGNRLIVSLAALSLALSPFWMIAARRLHDAAPQGISNLNQLFSLIFGKEIRALSRMADRLSGEKDPSSDA